MDTRLGRLRRAQVNSTSQRRPVASARVPSPLNRAAGDVATLQRLAGNKTTVALIRRKPAPPAYQNCAGTGAQNINLKIENGRQRAIDYVQVAIRALKGDPDAASADPAYKKASQRHFRSASAADRAAIRSNFEKILPILKSATRIRCPVSDAEVESCAKRAELFGFIHPGGDTIVVCPHIVDEPIRCRAIGLIHEAAHIAGVGVGATHPTRRGMEGYPWPGAKTGPGATETTAVRIDNPDAYGYFAAEVWREVDTSCPPPFVPGDITIIIEGTAP